MYVLIGQDSNGLGQKQYSYLNRKYIAMQRSELAMPECIQPFTINSNDIFACESLIYVIFVTRSGRLNLCIYIMCCLCFIFNQFPFLAYKNSFYLKLIVSGVGVYAKVLSSSRREQIKMVNIRCIIKENFCLNFIFSLSSINDTETRKQNQCI